ncbi:asparagine synthase C-terminal domain-containing protein (plasmid) [Sinorhizobium meliloti]|uniref:asparagine synthetase B family protein n=1 Tax=Rhizobium meliloti TaxID=382 RepID=UPI00037968AC|nr:asparagine synthase C-terminal domain-containing protein [Sinorhizobium meliloti]ASQ02447.1 asparagine synthase [Sinorhizobium meliloti]MDE4547954.1 asparagine synthase C-terminal domain-containing protein [Sinorhizobium meliloti]MDE4571573.1 asparagine synthase C-terminal domain-containing protein [Sinorhizobium meliloti]
MFGSIGMPLVDPVSVSRMLKHRGNYVDTINGADISLTTVSRSPGRIFKDPELMVAYTGTPSVEGKQISMAAELAELYALGKLDAPDRVNGHYCIALIDLPKEQIRFLRDNIGVNTLYVTRIGRGLAFCTEYKCLRALPGFDRSIDREAIKGFERTGWVPSGATFFSQVKPVLPGKWSTVRNDDNSFPSEAASSITPAIADAFVPVEVVADALLSAVERLSADQPPAVGIMLSSGVDSALIAELVARSMKQITVKSFTVGHNGGDPEIEGAQLTALALGLDHHELLLEPSEFTRLLPEAMWAMENPGGYDEYPCLLGLSEMAGSHVDVLFSGNLSDTLFGGMNFHTQLWKSLNGLPTDEEPIPNGSLTILKGSTGGREAILRTRSPAHKSLHAELVATMDRRDERMGAQEMLAARFGIDLRMPYADTDVVRTAMRIPDSQKVSDKGNKLILREASAIFLPEEIVKRPKRIQQLMYDSAMRTWLLSTFDLLFNSVGAQKRDVYDYGNLALVREELVREVTRRTVQNAWKAISIETWLLMFADEEHFASAMSDESVKPEAVFSAASRRRRAASAT